MFQSNKERNSGSSTVDFKMWGKAWNTKRYILFHFYAEDLIRPSILGTYTVPLWLGHFPPEHNSTYFYLSTFFLKLYSF